MVNYGKGKIYKIEPICEHDAGEIYIGSTTKDYLSQRMDTHRSNFKQWLKGKRGKTMSFDLFVKYGIGSCRIILLESVNANNKDELSSREAYYMLNMNCVNKNIPMAFKRIGQVEYSKRRYKQNRDSFNELSKHYYQQNRDKVLSKGNKIISCDCGVCFTVYNKSKHIKSINHQNYINNLQYEYFWEDGTPCSKEEYEKNQH